MQQNTKSTMNSDISGKTLQLMLYVHENITSVSPNDNLEVFQEM